jgi:hypothetical protein
MFRKCWARHALRDHKGIASQRCKEFTQYLWLLRVFRHAIHFSLQLRGGNRPLPVILQRL